MTTDELHALAHHIAYLTAKSDIESFTMWRDDRIAAPVEPSFLTPNHRWYDISTVIIGEFERDAVGRAIGYLDARSLLHRKPDASFMVQILPPLSSGALVPPTLAEVLSA